MLKRDRRECCGSAHGEALLWIRQARRVACPAQRSVSSGVEGR